MEKPNRLRVGTRASQLATVQTNWVAGELKKRHPGLDVEIIFIRTTGDAITDRALSKVGGKGLFTREIETALLAGEVDLAVHSLKDLPTQLPEGLAVGAIPLREDPRDALIGKTLDELRASAGQVRIGTSSLRRAAQLRRAIPGADVVDLRGNIDTRVRKVHDGVVDCAVLALAGLKRLSREDEVSGVLEADVMLAAPAQGALGIEIREGDARVQDMLGFLHSTQTQQCVTAERVVLEALGGGCQVPVAALATIEDGVLQLRARVVSLDGATVVEAGGSGRPDCAGEVGRNLAEILIEQGASRIIEKILGELEQGDENA